MTAELKPYSKMKDSGIAWLGMVPEHWKIVRQRYLCSTKTGTRDTVHQVDQGKYPFFVRSQTAVKIDTYSFDGEAVLTAGDGDIGKIFHYINGKFDFHQRVYKFSDFREVLGKFYFYYASANLHQEVLRLSAKSTVDSIRLPMLQNFPVVIPSVPEQVAIARYLDYVDVRVRRLTEAKRKLIGLLTEYKQAIVHRAVTRGLDPNVPLKDSGIEWLGMVPQHWEVRRLKQLCSKSALYGANISAEKYSDVGVRFLRTTDITEKGELKEGGVFLDINLVKDYILEDGDLLISRSGTVGRSLLYNSTLHGPCSYAGYLVRFVPTSELVPGYMFMFTKTQAFEGFLRVMAISSTIDNVNGEKYANCPVPLPPVPEQIAIVEYLDRATAEIDIAVARAERQIELLNEYRTRLIADVVTGKLDVRDTILTTEDTDTSTALASTDSAHRSDLNGEHDR